jgi:hypothetical protein
MPERFSASNRFSRRQPTIFGNGIEDFLISVLAGVKTTIIIKSLGTVSRKPPAILTVDLFMDYIKKQRFDSFI